MALDRRKGLQTAERLLKQGKLQAALSELQRVSESAPNDLLTLNRLGDLLARQGRRDEAISYYAKIAAQFEQGGFVPKAIAIHKKILRLDPAKLDSMVALGGLYLDQKLNGEARSYLLHASNLHLQNQDFEKARGIFEKLVEAEPDDPRHRVRLAETRAAEGRSDLAALDLVELGTKLLGSGKPQEAEKIFSRAAELSPSAFEPVLGIVSAFDEQGRTGEGISLLEKHAGASDVSPALVGELALRYEQAGRSEDAMNCLKSVRIVEVPVPTLHSIFRTYFNRTDVDSIWERMDPLFESAASGADSAPLVTIFESLVNLEEHGHVPALQRLADLQKRRNDTQGAIRALEWLIGSYQSRSMHDEASMMLDQLRDLAPDSPLVRGESLDEEQIDAAIEFSSPDSAVALSVTPDAPGLGVPANQIQGELPGELAAPAVPLSKADQEFVAGRVTQAEVLEKYGLRQQALDQLEEVAGKFPGHVDGMRRRVAMLRPGTDAKLLHDALAQLALALRAAGETEAAGKAAVESASCPELEGFLRRALTQAQLIAPAAARPVARKSAPSAPSEIDILVDLDSAEDEVAATPVPSLPLSPAVAPRPAVAAEAPAPTPAAAGSSPAARPTRSPSADMLEEIRFYLEQNNFDDARNRIKALSALGYASAELDSLRNSIDAGASAPVESIDVAMDIEEPSVAPVADASPPADEPLESFSFDDDDDDDLNAITAALESELFDVDSQQPLVPEEDPEQSLDEVLATFKSQVQQEVGVDDYRTHYDLGIAYKEMGLVAEAISEFETAMVAPEFLCEACSMIAICHAELDDTAQAEQWYRKAIDSSNGDPQILSGLRYDLADLLARIGDSEAALSMFRDVLQADPSFRDVQGRISALETTV